MSYYTQLVIAWMMFKDWLQKVFTEANPLAPGYQQGWVK